MGKFDLPADRDFASRLVAWQRAHGRHDLPWQGQGAYRVWVSEIMLQQTQVATVIPFYRRFIHSFPDIAALAAASEEQVLAHWSGLGYYARGRNLHRAARVLMARYRGEFPRQFAHIVQLPGVGRSTAAAICALAFHQRCAILDGNVKRVLARHCGIERWPGERQVEERLWQQAEARLPQWEVARYTQGLMDLGATVCTRNRPKCEVCPVRADCVALQTGRVAELPARRPKKMVPERHVCFLLLMHGNEILLEQRPGSGIWGGLWCPPQVAADEESWYLNANSLAASARVELPPLQHAFTHFRLQITPVLLRVSAKPLHAGEHCMRWQDVETVLQAAIPAPVRRILRAVCGSNAGSLSERDAPVSAPAVPPVLRGSV